MKVLLLIKGLGLGGAEKHVVDLAIDYKLRGIDVEVAYMLPNKCSMVSVLEKNNIKVNLLGGKLWWLVSFYKMFFLLRKFKPSIVHSHLPIPGIYSRLFKSFFGFRLVYTEHNVYQRMNLITRLIHRLTHNLDDESISCSRPVSSSLPWHSTVIENGISITDESNPLSDNSFLRDQFSLNKNTVIFICVANLLKKKNHMMLLNAFEEAFSGEDDLNGVALVLVGQHGTEYFTLVEKSKSLKTSERIFFYGSHPEAVKLIAESDVFCLSSTYEGLPIALLESMSKGIPAVVTNVGGMPDVVKTGINGYVVEIDDIKSYADAIYELYINESLRSQLGINALKIVKERCSFEAMVDSILNTYDK